MLRITPLEAAGPGAARLALEGRLVGPWNAELRAAVAAARPGRVILSLSSLHYVDTEGLALLHQLMDQGVTLQEVSPFIQELLKAGMADPIAVHTGS